MYDNKVQQINITTSNINSIINILYKSINEYEFILKGTLSFVGLCCHKITVPSAHQINHDE